MNVKNVLLAMQEIENNRNIPKEVIIDALQDSLMKAYRRQIGVPDALVAVEIDETTEEMKLYHQFLVVEEVEDDELEVALEEVTLIDNTLKPGDYYKVEQSIAELGRAAATLAKNVIKQKIREAEKQAVYDEYINQLGELILAMIESVEEKFIVVNLGRALAVMPKTAQIDGEQYREGQTLKVVITDVNRDSKGAQILVSRADAMLVRRLFEKEVPEIFQGQVEIKAIAREAGERTKMAVYSHDPDIDAIGACIGPRGSRVQVVIEELKGEKIDIFEWSDNIIELIKNSLSPAEIKAVFPNPNQKGLMVVVEDNQLSLAIGKKGKNAKLAVRLTKQRIDIKSVTDADKEGIDYVSLMAAYEATINASLIAHEIEIEPIEEPVEEITMVSLEPETATDPVEEVKPVKVKKKATLVPRTDYVSKFEEIADASKTTEQETRYRRRKEKEREDEKAISTSELLRQKEYEILPEYSPEELEEINRQQQIEQESWYKDDIDFDEFDEYYDQE